MSNYQVRDEASPRSNFTMIPNIVDDKDLSVYAYRLYGHLRRVAGEDGVSFRSTKTLATECKMSAGSVSDAKQELVEAGLIEIEVVQNHGEFAKHLITIKDIWAENHTKYLTRSPHEQERSPHEQERSPHEQERSPHEPINIPIKKTLGIKTTSVAPNGAGEKIPKNKNAVQEKPPEKLDPILEKFPVLRKMPRENGELLVAFAETSGINPIEQDFKIYLKATWEMRHRGITPDIVRQAVQKMRRDSLTISSPLSVMKVCISLKASSNGNGASSGYDYDAADRELERIRRESREFWEGKAKSVEPTGEET